MAPVSLPPDILVVRLSAIGDILLTTPLLRALRRRHPGARITVLTRRQYLPLLADNPNVDQVVALAAGQRTGTVARRLRRARHSHLIDLQGGTRTWPLRALVPGRWSRYSNRRLARELLIRTKRDRYRDHRPVAERYFEAARDLDVRPDGCPPDFFLGEAAEAEADAWLAQAGVLQSDTAEPARFVAIAPGAAHATKRWSVAHWIALAERLTRSGVHVVILGGPDDSAVAGEILAHAAPAEAGGRLVSAAGALGLQTTGAVIRRARALVSGDTGVMHMATGVGTPVVSLFGPTVRQFGFFPYSARATVLERDLPCRPCSSHGSARCPLGHHRCLREITADAVFAALRGVLP